MSAALEVRAIRKSFGGLRVLDGCQLSVPRGSILGIVGPNGAGKSTLFGVISGFVPADAGHVWLEGREVTRLPPHDRVRLGLVRTFQVPREFPELTVVENLLVAPLGQTGERLLPVWLRWRQVAREEKVLREQAMSILRLLRLEEVAWQPAGELSGGQKKLLEVGRALMLRPRVLLLDEPYAGVHASLAAVLSQQLRSLAQEGVAVVVVEHNLHAVRELCHRVLVMASGRVLVEGPPDAVFSDNRVVAAYLGRGTG